MYFGRIRLNVTYLKIDKICSRLHFSNSLFGRVFQLAVPCQNAENVNIDIMRTLHTQDWDSPSVYNNKAQHTQYSTLTQHHQQHFLISDWENVIDHFIQSTFIFDYLPPCACQDWQQEVTSLSSISHLRDSWDVRKDHLHIMLSYYSYLSCWCENYADILGGLQITAIKLRMEFSQWGKNCWSHQWNILHSGVDSKWGSSKFLVRELWDLVASGHIL